MKRILVLLLLLPVISLAQPLTGNYVVGTSQSAPYNTLANAITKINSVGVSGPVTFLVDNDQSVSSALIINSFTGSSATNTFTIRPNTGKTIVISGTVANGAVFQFNGADNVIIDGNNGSSDNKLTVYNTFSDTNNSYTSRAAVWFYNTADKNKVQNATLKMNIVDINAGTISAGVFSGGNSLGNSGNNSNNTISNVVFTDVKQAVYVNGSSSSNTNWTISNNTIGSASDSSKPYLGIYFNNVTTYTVSGNTLNGIKKPSGIGGSPLFSAIYLLSSASGTISGNTVTNVTNNANSICYGIYVQGNTNVISGNAVNNITTTSTDNGNAAIAAEGSNETIFNNKVYTIQSTQEKLISGIYINGSTALVYNNMVGNVVSSGGGDPASQGGYGIYINSGDSVKLYYNSVRLATNQSSGASACLFINGGTQLDIRNNVFVNAQTSGSSRFAVYSNITSTSSFTNIDYNDYVSTQYIGTFGSFYTSGNLKSTLAQWQSATTKDSHSISVAPTFISATDLHLSAANASFDDKGTAISGITTDIDSDSRSASPDMGADEFAKCSGGTTTWNGSGWSNGTPTITTKAIINGNFTTSSNGNLQVCELVVNANFTLTVTEDRIVEIQNDLTVNGTLTIEDKGSLVQNDDAGTATGNIILKRKTTAIKQYDYTYWCSPVVGATLNTVANNGPSVFYSFEPTINDYQDATSATVMTTGKGYISRAPGNLTYNPTQVLEVTFTGVANTGPYTVQATKSSSSNANLIGNPYPSALDADAFISNSTNAAALTGTIYIWTHNKAISASNPGNNTLNYSSDDYAKYNLSGGTKAASYSSGGTVPSGKIASGQGFFVETTGSAGVKNLVFNNAMRVKTAAGNGQFFRSSNPGTATVAQGGEVQKNRVWLSLTNEDGAYNEMLLAYITGATNDLDYGYDGQFFDGGNYVAIYSLLGDEQLSIQGRDVNFDEQDVVPLGFNSLISGTLTIGIQDVDGFFGDQNVYLLDKTNNTLTNLKNGSYSFTTATGTFNDRFELRFTDTALGVENPVLDKNSVTVITNNGNQLQIRSAQKNIASVVVYDLLGRIILEKKNINARDFTTNSLGLHNQAIIVKIKADDNSETVKKAMVN